jgi:hypothetical protein
MLRGASGGDGFPAADDNEPAKRLELTLATSIEIWDADMSIMGTDACVMIA